MDVDSIARNEIRENGAGEGGRIVDNQLASASEGDLRRRSRIRRDLKRAGELNRGDLQRAAQRPDSAGVDDELTEVLEASRGSAYRSAERSRRAGARQLQNAIAAGNESGERRAGRNHDAIGGAAEGQVDGVARAGDRSLIGDGRGGAGDIDAIAAGRRDLAGRAIDDCAAVCEVKSRDMAGDFARIMYGDA